MANIVVLGAGMMGSALCFPLCDRGHRVHLVGTHLDGEIIASIQATRLHPKLNLSLPQGLRAYPIEELADAMSEIEAVVLGVSSAGVEWAAQRLTPWLSEARSAAPSASGSPLPIAMISKGLGFDGEDLITLPEVFTRALPMHLRAGIDPVGIAGPCIAGELARRVPTCAVFVSRGQAQRLYFAELCEAPYYRVFTRSDVIGVETCAALKNAFAMGVALGAGIHAAAGGEPGSIAFHNHESAVFAQALWEMRKLVRHLGGDPEQVAWLPGAGDLDVTCNGGRTGRFGQLLGMGLSPQQAQERMAGATLECLEILQVLRLALGKYRARGALAPGGFPLLDHLAAIALDGAAPNLPFAEFFDAATRV